jgi:hypothetical protein
LALTNDSWYPQIKFHQNIHHYDTDLVSQLTVGHFVYSVKTLRLWGCIFYYVHFSLYWMKAQWSPQHSIQSHCHTEAPAVRKAKWQKMSCNSFHADLLNMFIFFWFFIFFSLYLGNLYNVGKWSTNYFYLKNIFWTFIPFRVVYNPPGTTNKGWSKS